MNEPVLMMCSVCKYMAGWQRAVQVQAVREYYNRYEFDVICASGHESTINVLKAIDDEYKER
jgi:hypothetical protein